MFVNLNLKISLWILVEFSLIFFLSKLAYVDFFQQFGADNYIIYCNKDTFYPLRRFLVKKISNVIVICT